jgi:hypothetical protein
MTIDSARHFDRRSVHEPGEVFRPGRRVPALHGRERARPGEFTAHPRSHSTACTGSSRHLRNTILSIVRHGGSAGSHNLPVAGVDDILVHPRR